MVQHTNMTNYLKGFNSKINKYCSKKKKHGLKKKSSILFILLGQFAQVLFFCKLQNYRFYECYVHESPSSSASSRMTGTPKEEKHFKYFTMSNFKP